MANTTKIILINTTTGEIIIFANKKPLADYFNTNWHNVVEWFRNDKIVRRDYAGHSYIIYKADRYITKLYPKGKYMGKAV